MRLSNLGTLYQLSTMDPHIEGGMYSIAVVVWFSLTHAQVYTTAK